MKIKVEFEMDEFEGDSLFSILGDYKSKMYINSKDPQFSQLEREWFLAHSEYINSIIQKIANGQTVLDETKKGYHEA